MDFRRPGYPGTVAYAFNPVVGRPWQEDHRKPETDLGHIVSYPQAELQSETLSEKEKEKEKK